MPNVAAVHIAVSEEIALTQKRTELFYSIRYLIHNRYFWRCFTSKWSKTHHCTIHKKNKNVQWLKTFKGL